MAPVKRSELDEILAREREAKKGNKNIMALAALAMIVIVVAIIIGSNKGQRLQSRSYQDIRDCDVAEDIISKLLVDPDSAQFQCAPKSSLTDEGRLMVVEVNAKNRAGGYNGFEVWGVLFLDGNRYKVIQPNQ